MKFDLRKQQLIHFWIGVTSLVMAGLVFRAGSPGWALINLSAGIFNLGLYFNGKL